MFGLFRRKAPPSEARATAPQSHPEFLKVLGLDQYRQTTSGITVTVDKALGVPAVWGAVNFISGTIAGLPLHVYRRKRNGDRERVSGNVASVLGHAVNPTLTSFNWRKYEFERILTTGRSISFIERNANGTLRNIFPLRPSHVTIIKIDDDTRIYRMQDGSRVVDYPAADILDIPFMLKEDGIGHYGPIETCKPAIALAIAATEYGTKFFAGGGVPPFAVTGNFQSSAALQRAADDLEAVVEKTAKEGRLALTLPSGLEIKPLGGDPEKSQLVESKQFALQEVARVYSLPPTFLQDLSHATFSNSEQQDLHLVKHTIKRWVEQVEEEMNLKIFGRNSSMYVEFSLDGLLRGDFKARMEGLSHAIQNALMTPNEARALDNRIGLPGGDNLMIQGATVPIDGHTQQEPDA